MHALPLGKNTLKKMRKSRLILLIILFGGLHGLSQVSDTTFSTPSSDTAYWNKIFTALLDQNNPYALLQIASTKQLNSKAIEKAKYLISDSVLIQYEEQIKGANPSKKRKIRKQDISVLKDSLKNLEFSSIENALHNLRTMHNFQSLIKDKELIFQCIDSILFLSKNPYLNLHLLEEKKRFASIYKKKDKLTEAQDSLIAFHQYQKSQYEGFVQGLINHLSINKEKPQPVVSNTDSTKKILTALNITLIVTTVSLALLLLLVFMKYKKKNGIAEQSVAVHSAYQEELSLKQKQLIFSDQTLRDLKQKLEELEKQKHHLQTAQQELHEDLKTQIDKVIKSPDVASIMELKNILSRSASR